MAMKTVQPMRVVDRTGRRGWMTLRASVLATAGVSTSLAVLGAAPAEAATMYTCPLVSAAPCSSPLSGTRVGDVASTSDGYSFNLSGNGDPGYVQVDNSKQINTTKFPFTFSAQVKGVGVPSTAVGDYDVVRGTPAGNWKLEVVAKNNRTTAQAACFFKGATSKKTVSGGPDLTTLQSKWTTISCTNTGSAVELRVNGVLEKKVTVSTGTIPNPGPLLIGAKDTEGGDQFSGYAKDVQINVP